ncbi:hypothetical protein QQP08_016486 [Theobroma cacao]|nr:hypothetical protein QQP08_016486 [Theobroma cacao]
MRRWFDSGNCYTVDEAIPKYALKTLLVIFLVLPPDMTDKMMMTANPSQKEVAEDVEDAQKLIWGLFKDLTEQHIKEPKIWPFLIGQ